MAHLASRNKPRKPLVLLLRPVRSRAGARDLSRDMKQNSEDAMGSSALECLEASGAMQRQKRSWLSNFGSTKCELCPCSCIASLLRRKDLASRASANDFEAFLRNIGY